MARLVFTLEDGTEIETELDSDVISIGRHPESTVVLPSSSVSAHHATIKHRGDSYYVRDLVTTNGTKINGVEVEEAKLEDGDRLSFGDVPAVVHLTESPAKKKSDSEEAEREKAKLAAARLKAAQRTTVYTESSGCAGILVLLAFLVFAFITGVCIRHANEHGGFLFWDIMKKKLRDEIQNGDRVPVVEQKKTDDTGKADDTGKP